jgi:hypothetical protein
MYITSRSRADDHPLCLHLRGWSYPWRGRIHPYVARLITMRLFAERHMPSPFSTTVPDLGV